jgi:hypothetical protein
VTGSDIARATITGFVLFIVLVWLANALGVALAEVLDGKLPPQLLAIMNPNATPTKSPTLIGDTPTF